MQALAKELAVVLIVPIFERQAPGVYRNSAAVIDADGSLLGVYRKMHIPDDPLFYEKYYFTPGDGPWRARAEDAGFRVWKTRYATIGVLICWDQWYPEAARITSLLGAQVLFYPTAIGWHPAEKDEWGAAQVDAWRTVQRAHAIANGVYVARRIASATRTSRAPKASRSSATRSSPIRSAAISPRRAKAKRSSSPSAIRRSSKTRAATGRSCAIAASTRTARFSSGTSARDADGSAVAHAGRVGAASRHLDRLAASRARLAGQARPDSVGLRRDRPRRCHARAGRDPLPQRGRARSAHAALDAHGVRPDRVRLHIVPTDRVWLRDSAPTGVHDAAGDVVLLSWAFNGWAKYDNWRLDEQVGAADRRR